MVTLILTSESLYKTTTVPNKVAADDAVLGKVVNFVSANQMP
jgi:hypothetical protein